MARIDQTAVGKGPLEQLIGRVDQADHRPGCRNLVIGARWRRLDIDDLQLERARLIGREALPS
jgi:hypothetical protein